MANNIIQVKRTNVSGRTPNTSSSGNSQYIAAGELALNMSDGILFTSNGSSLIEVGANNTSQNISTNNLTVGNTLYVVANGNVGIGTNTPTDKLEISGNATGISITQSVMGNYLNGLKFKGYDGAVNGGLLWNQNTGEVRLSTTATYFPTFYSNGVEAARISTNGNVGIGNTAPTHKLRVEGTVSIAGNTTPSANLTYDLGSPTLYWNNVYSNSIISNSASFSSNVSVGNTLSVSNNITVNKNLDITSKNVVGLTNIESTVLTSFHVGDYKGGKFTILAKRGNDTHMAEVMVTHNVESAFYNEYSVVYSNVSLFSVSADISGSNVRLLATSSTPSDIQFQVMENKFAVDLDVYDRARTLLLDRAGSVIDERRITREISFGLDFINNSYGLVT